MFTLKSFYTNSYNYDNDNLISSSHITENSKLNRYYNYLYENNLLRKVEIFNDEEKKYMCEYSLYTYDDKGNQTLEELHYNDNIMKYYSFYDNNGYKIKWVCYDNDKLTHLIKNYYSEDGKLIKEEHYGVDFTQPLNSDIKIILKRYKINKYSEDGKLIKEQIFSDKNELKYYTDFYYDDKSRSITEKKLYDTKNNINKSYYCKKYYDDNNDKIS